VFPEPVRLTAEDPGVSGVWQHLESTATGRSAGALKIGVLGADGLWLPKRRPVPVPLPGNVDQVPELMRAYGLKTLWVHESAALEMGLPQHEVRRQGPRVDGKVPGRMTVRLEVQHTQPHPSREALRDRFSAGKQSRPTSELAWRPPPSTPPPHPTTASR